MSAYQHCTDLREYNTLKSYAYVQLLQTGKYIPCIASEELAYAFYNYTLIDAKYITPVYHKLPKT